MLRKRDNKKEKRQSLPTAEEFLKRVPKKSNLEWSINSEGFVEIKVPKFTSKFGKSFCKIIRREETFVAKMDKIGTIVWKNCDGKKSVKQILEKLKKEYPNEKEIDQRLFLFIQQMISLNYLYF
ncbi:MAG: PqqD family protein [Thermoplasmatales archaeon]|nr:MAG: PqqD family protein [Thermoplasmatales archaeon]